MSLRIALSSNTAWNLYNFRRGLLRSLVERGWQVLILAPQDECVTALVEMGCTVVDCPMDNKGAHPVHDMATFFTYWRLYRKLKPDIALHYTIKPVIYGTLAARSLGIPCINTITGLGTAFIRETWLTRLVESLYRLSQRWPTRVFFQNPDDQALFLKRRLVRLAVAECLPGSGVDLGKFLFSPMPQNQAPVFLLIARMLGDKGVGEFVQAARLARAINPAARFQLLGQVGVENRTAIPREQVEGWAREGVVEYLGSTDDVRPFINKAHCVVLPSYREGTPRTLLEAAAMGRPVIATDVPGCREVVDDGRNGFLCKVKDAEDLSVKMMSFLALGPAGQASMGREGRAKMEREFDEKIVIHRYLHVIEGIFPRSRTLSDGEKKASPCPD